MNNKISLFHSGMGDWVGIYINGRLIDQDHDFTPYQILKILSDMYQFEVENKHSKYDDLEPYGFECPEYWSEIIEKEG